MTSLRNIFAVTLLLGQMSCVSLERSPSSGYRDWKYPDGSEVSIREGRVLGRPGIQKSEIEVLESGLRTESDSELYDQARPVLKSEKEKKEFLTQKGKTAQKRWLASRGIDESSLFENHIREAIDQGDVILNMSRDAVLKSWGDPDVIEVAGNPDLGNERWIYIQYEASPEGYQKQERSIYFKSGKVAGWETR